jgi:hypothetical protein
MDDPNELIFGEDDGLPEELEDLLNDDEFPGIFADDDISQDDFSDEDMII